MRGDRYRPGRCRGSLTLAGTALELSAELHDDRPEKHGLLSGAGRGVPRARHPRSDGRGLPRQRDRGTRRALTEGLGRAGARRSTSGCTRWGHAHMGRGLSLARGADPAEERADLFQNVLRLMDRHPEFRFSHSQPQLYAFTEEDYPRNLRGVSAPAWRRGAGRSSAACGWNPTPTCRGPRRWCARSSWRATIATAARGGGSETPCLWLPDTFGFPGCLPQLMKQAGLKWFVTQQGELEPVQTRCPPPRHGGKGSTAPGCWRSS